MHLSLRMAGTSLVWLHHALSLSKTHPGAFSWALQNVRLPVETRAAREYETKNNLMSGSLNLFPRPSSYGIFAYIDPSGTALVADVVSSTESELMR